MPLAVFDEHRILVVGAILLLAVVAAVATPTPDPVTMMIAMAPLVILFELSILLARIFERRAERRADDEWDPDDDPAVS